MHDGTTSFGIRVKGEDSLPETGPVTCPQVAEGELRAYEGWLARQADLAPLRGQTVAIHGSSVIGPFELLEDAERAAYDRFGRVQIYLFEIGSDAIPVAEMF